MNHFLSRLIDPSATKRARLDSTKLFELIKATVTSLWNTVEKVDSYTANHQTATANLCLALGRRLGLTEERMQGLGYAAALHDIGKVGVPSQILTKPSRLSPAEMALVREHVQHGYDILKGLPLPFPVAETVLQHHERLDGSGYPRGLKANQIILEARIVAVADVIDSVAANRPYRKALGPKEARSIIEEGAGTLFDTDVVDAANDLIEQIYA